MKKKETVKLTIEEFNALKNYFELSEQLHRAYEDEIQMLKEALKIY